ncbi:hypothetical protein BpHYR1_023743 [Brachionus plicatilis]|uniref:Uncharacterized protein n=1 Tax=Brachionus plicatilis TaxID=10195 RepID=A0A3M7RQB5_BRAPC|nr:hypothetical protein BpHYR1_023743 [Brachionus plicatilis]
MFNKNKLKAKLMIPIKIEKISSFSTNLFCLKIKILNKLKRRGITILHNLRHFIATSDDRTLTLHKFTMDPFIKSLLETLFNYWNKHPIVSVCCLVSSISDNSNCVINIVNAAFQSTCINSIINATFITLKPIFGIN